ncbi:alpha-hydroxy acid oxidase [Micromonospora eburnea]|uniref:4-hydroxymandelate oxidase n=1 Tax=Micromonospora eburnea TaxID=227316 RepID=A0A1C6V0N6_9ACTN|nr:alpha-hydroxy acid oxidase [Micromonospora eburnea]SCL59674.1 4-hydroxymandelate oxidase [Micromonospora eburnea]
MDEDTIVCLADYEPLAAARIAPEVWDYLNGGSGTEATVRANRAAFDRVPLYPRVLVNVSRVDTATTLLGDALAAPLGVAPTAFHRLAHPDGEVATARAAGEAGLLYIISIMASRRLEDIAAAATGPLWLQLYWLRRRQVLLDLVRRAADCGVRAIVLTVDTPKVGRRLRDLRNGFRMPDGVTAVNLDRPSTAGMHEREPGASALERHSRHQFDPSLSWTDLAWLRENSPLPFLVKGILTGADADLAVRNGAAGVIVSNHGGRQLDGAVASLDALPGVVAAVNRRCPVLLDGGVRTGSDALKALALGADVVLLGRPVLWGLAVGGADGARDVLATLAGELTDAMMLAGRPTLSDVDARLVRPH